jgi:hypothetical protein
MAKVYRIDAAGPVQLQPVPGPGVPILNTLTMPPGNYICTAYDQFVYPCVAPGLYAWCNFVGTPLAANFRIVGNPSAGVADVVAVLSACAWLMQRGCYDLQRKPAETMAGALARNKLDMTTRGVSLLCGQSCLLAESILKDLAPPLLTRQVRMVTAGPLNGYDEGHQMLEIFSGTVGGRWSVFDLLNDRCWSVAAGIYASFAELIADLTLPALQLARMSDGHLPYVYGQSTGFHGLAFFASTDLTEWTRRIFQIPGIDSGGLTYCYLPVGTETRATWVSQTLGWQILSRDEWLTRFYG